MQSQYVILIMVIVITVLTTPLQVLFIFRNFTRRSGLPELMSLYGVAASPSGDLRPRQIIRIGSIYFRYTVTVGITGGGLYISMGTFGRLLRVTPMLIPWADIEDSVTAKLYGKPAMELMVGEPHIAVITVMKDTYDLMLPYLDLKAAAPLTLDGDWGRP
jgi:hypothetical protein